MNTLYILVYTSWRPLKVNVHFGGTCHISSVEESSTKHVESRSWLMIDPWRWRRYVPSKHRLTFSVLHSVVFHKTDGSINTAVRNLGLVERQWTTRIKKWGGLSSFGAEMWCRSAWRCQRNLGPCCLTVGPVVPRSITQRLGLFLAAIFLEP
jgi:hypothetical protein